MNCLWSLIQDEAQAVDGYLNAIHELTEGLGENPENQAAIDVINKIIGEERDHMNALNYVYSSLNGGSDDKGVMTFAEKQVQRIKARKVMEASK